MTDNAWRNVPNMCAGPQSFTRVLENRFPCWLEWRAHTNPFQLIRSGHMVAETAIFKPVQVQISRRRWTISWTS